VSLNIQSIAEVNMTKIVLLNGPPGSGKDSLGNYIAERTWGGKVYKFADAVKRGTHALYGMADVNRDFFEQTKETPNPLFDGLTPRQAYIHYSEKVVKPIFGPQWFGKMFVRQVTKNNTKLALVTDSGFWNEIEPVIEAFGKENVLLVRIHADSRGKSFAGDSRNYVHTHMLKSIDLYNDGLLKPFLTEGLKQVWRWYDDARGSDSKEAEAPQPMCSCSPQSLVQKPCDCE
jgi:hypothetical protein